MKSIVALREGERERLDSARRMRLYVLEAEEILGGAGLPPEQRSMAVIGERLDRWCGELALRIMAVETAAQERLCLAHFVAVTQRLRPHLLECYRETRLPRTNNDMEGFIRKVKSRYRRISGRKNWNRYLLRYGGRIVYYEPSGATGEWVGEASPNIRAVAPGLWRAARAEQQERQQEQLQQYRFRHKRAAFLAKLQARWAATSSCTEPLL